MKIITLEYCSLHYLNIWLNTDMNIHKDLIRGEKDQKLESIKKALIAYGIARTLPNTNEQERNEKHKNIKYRPILNVLDKIKRRDIKSTTLIKDIEEISHKIAKLYNRKNLLSLTTKLLWLKLRSPIIIYDKRARMDLQAKDGDLNDFYFKWKIRYSLYEKKIEIACKKLKKVYKYTIDPEIATPEYVFKISEKKWFKERVFDSFLWHGGLKKYRNKNK